MAEKGDSQRPVMMDIHGYPGCLLMEMLIYVRYQTTL